MSWKPKVAERTAQWLWWSTLIFLLLRTTKEENLELEGKLQSDVQIDLASNHKNDDMDDKSMLYSGNISATPRKPQPKTPSDLKMPECEDSINDCAYGGKCAADSNGYKSCLCPASCPAC
uniref:ShKT domain-containing protein n=1 Tax=Elaeophora elaphi TaxID=1147741 RepID=A0A0R3S3R0_9BILA